MTMGTDPVVRADQHRPQRTPQVLLVDDDAEEAQALVEQLGDRYGVRTLADAAQAMAGLQGALVDIFICDETAAESAGAAFLQSVKRATAGAKIVILTTFVNLDKVIATIQSVNIDYFLTKPLQREQINLVVDKAWTERRRELEQEALLAQNHRTIADLQRIKGDLEARVREHADALIQVNSELERALLEIQQKNRELTKLNESLGVQATIDPLTGLHNRREFDRRLAEEWGRFQRYHRPLSLIMVDIDRFKSVNDTYGHECGDRVLYALAALMRSGVRIQDTVCRIGGEEFIALLPETPLDAAFRVAENLRRRVAATPFHCNGKTLRIQISLGVAGASDHVPQTPEGLVKLTDKSMYRAKEDGRNRTVALDPADPQRVLWASGS